MAPPYLREPTEQSTLTENDYTQVTPFLAQLVLNMFKKNFHFISLIRLNLLAPPPFRIVSTLLHHELNKLEFTLPKNVSTQVAGFFGPNGL